MRLTVDGAGEHLAVEVVNGTGGASTDLAATGSTMGLSGMRGALKPAVGHSRQAGQRRRMGTTRRRPAAGFRDATGLGNRHHGAAAAVVSSLTRVAGLGDHMLAAADAWLRHGSVA